MALAILSMFLPFVVIETTGTASSGSRSDRALELAVQREIPLGKHRCPPGSQAPRCQRLGPMPSATPTASPTPTGTTSTPTTTTPPTTTTTTQPVGGLPPGVTLREVDGGPTYFARWPDTLPSDPSFFPIGVWLQCLDEPGDAALFANAGINVFNTICGNADFDLVPPNMHVLAQFELNDISSHPRIDGRFLGDEADMMFGPGRDAWNGIWGWNTCVPPQDSGGKCGYTVMQTHALEAPPDHTPRYANYGLGVWEGNTDAEASVFINQYTDFVSADVYFFTHPSMAESERHGRSYGHLIDRMRYLDGLDGQRQPVWAFIEVGHPFTEDSAPTITPAQIRSAVWHSIIAGARGVTYFNHSFGGTDACGSWNIIRTCADVRAMVTSIDGQIRDLAPVLNGPFADGYVSTSSGVRAATKLGPDGAWYVFAGSTNSGGAATFTVAAGSTVEVLYEGRDLGVNGNQFTDSFTNGNTIHIYRITG